MLLGPVAVVAAMDKATSDMGPPDLAINSAGMMRNGEFTALPYETFERVVRVNLLGSRNFAAGALMYPWCAPVRFPHRCWTTSALTEAGLPNP